MTSTTLAPSTQLRLPGQAAAPDGPVDLTIMFVVHHAFRRDLAAFARAAAATPTSDRAAWTALAERWELFSTVLHHHHTGEDTGLWPALMARVDAEGRATLEAMEAEHAEIDPLLRSSAEGFARLATVEDEPARVALAGCLAAAQEHLARHLQHEERDALRLVQQHLTPADWLRLDEEHFTKQHSNRDVLRLVPWVVHDLPAEGVERMKRQPGGRVLFLVWRLALRRGFERRERVAFRWA